MATKSKTPKRKTRKVGRDAITGEFLSIKVAKRRKKTAIIQTIPV